MGIWVVRCTLGAGGEGIWATSRHWPQHTAGVSSSAGRGLPSLVSLPSSWTFPTGSILSSKALCTWAVVSGGPWKRPGATAGRSPSPHLSLPRVLWAARGSETNSGPLTGSIQSPRAQPRCPGESAPAPVPPGATPAASAVLRPRLCVVLLVFSVILLGRRS